MKPDRNGGMKLAIAEKILLHLYRYRNNDDEFNADENMTQRGVAATVGITRAHAAIELKRLMEDGLIERRYARVRQNGGKKYLTYRPTSKGVLKAKEFLMHLRDLGLTTDDVVRPDPERATKASVQDKIRDLYLRIDAVREETLAIEKLMQLRLDWLPVCAGELLDLGEACATCPFRQKCSEMEAEEACGVTS